MSIEDVVKNHIQQVLDYVNWDKKKAIQILQISKPTLYQKIEKYNLKPSGD
jgi:DNA-binding NtrC family response regulator